MLIPNVIFDSPLSYKHINHVRIVTRSIHLRPILPQRLHASALNNLDISQTNIRPQVMTNIGTLFAQTCVKDIIISDDERRPFFEIFALVAYILIRIAFTLFKFVRGRLNGSHGEVNAHNYPTKPVIANGHLQNQAYRFDQRGKKVRGWRNLRMEGLRKCYRIERLEAAHRWAQVRRRREQGHLYI